VRSVVEAADHATDLSLLTRVSPKAPPFLIAHGDRDHVVAVSEGQALHDALSRADADTQFMLLGGAGHEGPEFHRPATLAMTAAWLRDKWTAGGPDTTPPRRPNPRRPIGRKARHAYAERRR
jgi:acetyl esterase/lipase